LTSGITGRTSGSSSSKKSPIWYCS